MPWLQPTPHVSSGSILDLVNRPTPVVDSLPEAPPPLPELLAGPARPPAARKREVGQLIVVVLRAHVSGSLSVMATTLGLASAQHLDETVKSPLCTVELTESPGGVESTRVDPRDPQNPVWDEEFRFVVHAAETTKAPTEPLLVKIRDETSGRAGDDQFLGQGQVSVVDSKTWVRNKDTGTYEFDDWVQLQRNGTFAGEVFLEMTFYPAVYRPNTKSMTGPSTRPASTITAPSPAPTNLSSLQRRPSRLDPSTRLQPGQLATHLMLQPPAGRFEPVPRPSKSAQPEAVQHLDPPHTITFTRPSNANEDATLAMTFSSAPESLPLPTRNNFPPSLVPGSRPPSHSPSGPLSGSYAQQPPTLVGQMSSLSTPEQLPSQETASSPSRRPLPSPPGASLVAYPQRQSYGAGAVCTEVGVLQPPSPAQHPQSSPSLENIGTVVSSHILQHPQPDTGQQQLMSPYQHAHQVQHHQSHQILPQAQEHQQPQHQQQMYPQEYRRTIQQQHQQVHREDLQPYQHMYQPSYPAASDQPNRSQYDPQPPLRVPDQSSTHRNSDAHSPSYFTSSPRSDTTQLRSSPSPNISPGKFSSEPPPRPPKTPYNAPSPVVSASPAVSPELIVPPPRHGSLPLSSASTSNSRMSSLELSPNVDAATPKSKDKGKQRAEPVPSPSSPSPSPSLKTLAQSSHLPSSSSASTSSGTGSSAKPSATKSSSVDPVMLADQARSLFRFQQEQEDARLAASLAEEAGAVEDQVRIQKAREDEEVVRKLLEEEEKMKVEEEKRNELMARQWEEREKEEKKERERKDEELAFKLAASRED